MWGWSSLERVPDVSSENGKVREEARRRNKKVFKGDS